MAFWFWIFCIFNCLICCCASKVNNTFSSPVKLTHLAVDSDTHTVYIGAVNTLYQLTEDLKLLQETKTGPVTDDKKCTPPITKESCPEAEETNNYVKLFVLDKPKDRIVVCGSVLKGICSLRKLQNISEVLYYSTMEGEKCYVATNDENISTVGLVSTVSEKSLLFVAKGNGQHDNGIFVSTRLIDPLPKDKVPFEALSEYSVIKQEYTVTSPRFLTVFEVDEHIYFIVIRLDVIESKNKTFIARLCRDHPDYSYVDIALECDSGTFNIAQSAYVANPGEELAQNMSDSGTYGTVTPQDKVLFVVFKKVDRGVTYEQSALCMFPLKQINEKIEVIRARAYGGNYQEGSTTVIYNPYGQNKDTGLRDDGTLQARNFPCGSDHLLFHIGSSLGVKVEPVKQYDKSLTAVAVAMENGHTVVFLGTSNGEIIKIFMRGAAEEYASIQLWNNNPVKGELVFGAKQERLYVMSTYKITYIPVQTCEEFKDCQSCMMSRDPYCGWCVSEGKCKRKSECARAEEENHWLWSPNNSCIKIIAANPEFLSIYEDPQEVEFTINPLPHLSDEDKLECTFGSFSTDATLTGEKTVVCTSPHTKDIPPTPARQDDVLVPVQLSFKTASQSVIVTSGEYIFYNCSAAMSLLENTPCISCVGRKWKCQWNQETHECKKIFSGDGTINNMEDCPQFKTSQTHLVPVDHISEIRFEGKNLQYYASENFIAGNDEMEFHATVVKEHEEFFFNTDKFSLSTGESLPLSFYIKEKETEKKIDSILSVTLYSCSYGRNDCSKCRAANANYSCVWCNTGSCVYRESCEGIPVDDCPLPKITNISPKYGPLGGGIRVTINGSNLGITADDVESITVAEVPCVLEKELYSVSERIVCRTGEVDSARKGGVTVTIHPNKTGSTDSVLFEYREPVVESIDPIMGIVNGGTTLTISGTFLNTASKEDVHVWLGNITCSVKQFGEQIECLTGEAPKESSVNVKMEYGKSIAKAGNIVFQYMPAPTITDVHPKTSFASGGRNITVSGTGFSPVRSPLMVVVVNSSPSRRKKRQVPPEFWAHSVEPHSDTVIIFSSPNIMTDPDDSMISTSIKMDGFTQILPSTDDDSMFKYFRDPEFENFTDPVSGNTVIYVKGSHLTDAMTKEEAQAFVGEEPCKIQTLTESQLYCEPPVRQSTSDTNGDLPLFKVKFGSKTWVLGRVQYDAAPPPPTPLNIILPLVIIPMVAIIIIAIFCYRRKSQQAEREYEKIRSQLEGLEESVRDRCKKEFTDLMIEMEDQTSDVNEAGIPFLDYKTYTDRVFFLPSKDGENDVMITGKMDIPEARRQTVENALNQFSNLLNSKSFLINFIHTMESQREFSAREKVYFASLLTIALHGKLEYYTDIMRALFLELMEQYVAKNPKLMLRRSETVVERMLANWMSICLYNFLKDSAGEPLYKLFKAIKHQVEKGPVDAVQKKAKYTLNDTGLLGDDVEYTTLTVNVIVQGEGIEATPVKVLNCDTVFQVKEKIIEQVYRNISYSQRPKAETVALEWRPGSTGQILSDLDLTSINDGRWKRLNTLKHYNVQDGATLVLAKAIHAQQPEDHQQDNYNERNALLEEDSKTWHLVRPADEVDESKSKRGSMKEKERTKAITEIYLTRLLSVKGTLQKFVDDFFHSVLSSSQVVPPAVKYFFDFLDEQAEKHEITDEDTIHIWKTNSLPLRFWVNILKNPHFIFDIHVHEVVDASLSVIAQTFMDACTRTEHKLSRDSPSNKLLYAKEISAYKKMVEDYYKGIRQMVPVSDQDMNTHLAEISRAHTDKLNTLVALNQLYQYASKYYDAIINALEEDPASQKMQLAFRLQQIAAALEDKVTDL